MDLQEFNTLVSGTRLSKDSREAARLVFVDGLKPVEAAVQMEISPQRMSQICTTIRREQEKRQGEVSKSVEAVEASYAIAVKRARDLLGDDARINEPQDAKRSIGDVVARTDFHLVQHVGKENVVIHNLAKLDRVPAVGKSVSIEYSNGKGVVKDRGQEKERGGISR